MKQEIWHGDCLELMKDVADESVDLIILDPPYFRILNEKWLLYLELLVRFLDLNNHLKQ